MLTPDEKIAERIISAGRWNSDVYAAAWRASEAGDDAQVALLVEEGHQSLHEMLGTRCPKQTLAGFLEHVVCIEQDCARCIVVDQHVRDTQGVTAQ